LIRENPTLRQQQELSWAALQSFRTLAGRVMEELQKQQEATDSAADSAADSASPSQLATPHGREAAPAGSAPNGGQGADEADPLQQAMADLENINAHLFSIEALMERIFDVRVPDQVEQKFRELAGELAPDPLNADRLRLNRLLHQTPDFPG
jgi:hypothetical protein